MLFRVEQHPERTGESLGYQWIEVLAIEPWCLVDPGETTADMGTFTIFKEVKNIYLCNTDQGLVQIASDDFWMANGRGERISVGVNEASSFSMVQ